MTNRKGIILAGGSGTRLHPLTLAISKQLLPVYDKPMVYYPLTTLMLAGIRDILVISTPVDLPQYQKLLGDGSQWGIRLSYKEQPSPDGLAQAYILGEEFLNGSPSLLILGDNIFYGHGLPKLLLKADQLTMGATVFGYRVIDPERYGVIDFDDDGRVRSITEKPTVPASNYAVTGLYFADETASDRARRIKPSLRGELEITSVLQTYLDQDNLRVELMGRGYAWLDTGTHESLLQANEFVRSVESRQGLKIACPEEIALHQRWINSDDLLRFVETLSDNAYRRYIESLLTQNEPRV